MPKETTVTHEKFTEELHPQLLKALERLEQLKDTNEVTKCYKVVEINYNEPKPLMDDGKPRLTASGEILYSKESIRVLTADGLSIWSVEPLLVKELKESKINTSFIFKGALQTVSEILKGRDGEYSKIVEKVVWKSCSKLFDSYQID